MIEVKDDTKPLTLQITEETQLRVYGAYPEFRPESYSLAAAAAG
jgi:hypothetical protein